MRTPAAGTGPCQPLSRFSHHLPPTIDFNLLDELSPYGRECARWQLLLITPYSFTAREGLRVQVPKTALTGARGLSLAQSLCLGDDL